MSAVIALACITGVGLLLVLTAWCGRTVTRLDRLQQRCAAAEAALLTHLARRSSIAVDVATAGLSDPARASALIDAATRAGLRGAGFDGGGEPRWTAESELSRALQLGVLDNRRDEPLVGLLTQTQRRASIARRIHNEGAASSMALRSRRRVRWFGLAGDSAAPTMIEFDDGMG